ncbi:MAG: hypothetical protein ACOCU5_00140 [Bacillota bacterium]
MGLALVFSLAACGEEEQGEYKPGLHLGYTEGNENSYAYVYVDEEGFIQDIFIDSVYAKRDSEGNVWDHGEDPDDDETTKYLATTKMSLDDGCGYHMHTEKEVEEDEDGNCYVEGEMMWHEQVEALADDIVENQGIPSYDLSEGALEDDAVAGVSITVDYLIEAVENALDQAELGEDESPSDFEVPEFDDEGDFDPGIVFGASDYSEGGENSVAIGAVNEDGNLVHMRIDSVYFSTTDEDDADYSKPGRSEGSTSHGIITTKMSLDYGCGYHMHTEKEVEEDDDGNCYVDGEKMWHEQVQAIADDVVDNQGVPSYDLDENYFDEDGDDTVSGVSITVNNYIAAIEDALE